MFSGEREFGKEASLAEPGFLLEFLVIAVDAAHYEGSRWRGFRAMLAISRPPPPVEGVAPVARSVKAHEVIPGRQLRCGLDGTSIYQRGEPSVVDLSHWNTKTGITINSKNESTYLPERERLPSLAFKYLLTNSFFRRAPAAAEAEKSNGAKNSGSPCAKKELPLAKIARQVDCWSGF
jgi:hypothetical protein